MLVVVAVRAAKTNKGVVGGKGRREGMPNTLTRYCQAPNHSTPQQPQERLGPRNDDQQEYGVDTCVSVVNQLDKSKVRTSMSSPEE